LRDDAERLAAASADPAGRIAQLIAPDADDFGFARASDGLAGLGSAARAPLTKALQNNPSPEALRRLTELLDVIGTSGGGAHPAIARQARAVEVLERLGTAEARAILTEAARGPAAGELTREARAAPRSTVDGRRVALHNVVSAGRLKPRPRPWPRKEHGMHWPNELIVLLTSGMEVTPVSGLTAEQVYRTMLDEAARRAVWRAGGNPALLETALRTPYTPIGSITNEFVNGLAERICFPGPLWSKAVDAIHGFMTEHAEEICANFKDEAQPYACGGIFGPVPPARRA
jgi:hypothetical protein